jgi:uncharacterized OsmC-like protein
MGEFAVRVAAGSLAGSVRADAVLPHRWTDGGVAVETAFTGAHLLHLSVAGCVLNDVYREALTLGVEVTGVLVSADGDFDRTSWASTGVSYSVEVDAPGDVTELLRVVDEVAEIPRALRAGARVEHVHLSDGS